jgi:hypothetical protein
MQRAMTRTSSVAAMALLMMSSACTPRAAHVPYALSDEDRARFGDRVLRVSVPGRDPMIFGLNDCIAYKALTAHQDIVGWKVVLASDWGQTSYPKWATVCTAQHISYERRFIVVSFCAQAFGAGGGCGGSDGTYRSRTGEPQGWQIKANVGWIALPNR